MNYVDRRSRDKVYIQSSTAAGFSSALKKKEAFLNRYQKRGQRNKIIY